MAPPEVDQGDYFNDLSRQLEDEGNDSGDQMRRNSSEDRPLNETQPKAKRIACVLCRKRKLRCDGARPTCSTCKRLSHDCAYDEVRKKSGPKRGYVKLLEARLQQVETLLKGQDPPEQPQPKPKPQPVASSSGPFPTSGSSLRPVPMGLGTEPTMSMPVIGTSPAMPDIGMSSALPTSGAYIPDLGPDPFSFQDTAMANDISDEGFPWEMIGLGLDEPLPQQDTIDDLHRVFFEKIHASCPILQRPRYLAACNLNHQMRPPIALRYAVWTLAASIADRYDSLAEHFYLRARKYLQADEMKNHGEGIISLQHCQAWVMICVYEFKNMYFPRAWQTTGRAVRMAQMLGLHRIDGFGLDVKQCLPPPKDWIEREERRRTFWLAFCEDRYASVGTGWPMTIDERDIMTNLPASEEAFNAGTPEQTISLEQALKPTGSTKLSPIGGVVLMSAMFGRNLLHLHRPNPDDNDDDLNGEFWRRHRRIEGILSHTALALPDRLRLPAGLPDPNVVFLNMAIHTSAICLHQAAIFKADRHKLPPNVGSESRVRCLTAAAEIARIMRMLSHLDLSTMNPFLAFCLYVAARVFVQYLKFRPKDEQMISSLQFLLAAMHALKRKNPLTESFLVQLDVDLEGMNIDVGPRMSEAAKQRVQDVTIHDNSHCSPIFEPSDVQKSKSPGSNKSAPTFGDNGIATHSVPNIGTQLQDSMNGGFGNNYFNPDSPSYSIPSRHRSTQYSMNRVASLGDSLSPPGSDNAPSPINNNNYNDRDSTRSNSYKDSSSHTSFTTPSMTDATSSTDRQNSQTANNNPSPQTMPSGATSSGFIEATNNFFNNNPMDSSFATFQPGFFSQPIDASGNFAMSGWEMPGIEITTGTGMTPMPTGMTPGATDWNVMLEGMDGYGGSSSNFFDAPLEKRGNP